MVALDANTTQWNRWGKEIHWNIRFYLNIIAFYDLTLIIFLRFCYKCQIMVEGKPLHKNEPKNVIRFIVA